MRIKPEREYERGNETAVSHDWDLETTMPATGDRAFGTIEVLLRALFCIVYLDTFYVRLRFQDY